VEWESVLEHIFACGTLFHFTLEDYLEMTTWEFFKCVTFAKKVRRERG